MEELIYLILIAYISIVFIGSLAGRRSDENTPESYFLANRNLGTVALFFTILATNFSAFYFLGFAGAGYRIGYVHFIIMSLGTGFAALSFFVLGAKIWSLGKEHGFITPAELIYHQTGSKWLRWIFAVIMLLFTFPYLALQIVGAGYILENITRGEVPYIWGATFLTFFTIVYVWIGGMKSVAKTDLKQGLLMIVLMILAVIVVVSNLGGLNQANEMVFEIKPELFSKNENLFPPKKWFSIIIFWFFCIPMFPQIFSRFYIAKDITSLKRSAVMYGLIPLLISILPVIIGVFGHITFPGLEGKETDQILPMMLEAHSPPWFSGLVMTGALAAFMSTLDSQLLALSTIVTRDFVLPFKKEMSLEKQVSIGRVWVVIFAFVGLAIAVNPFDTIDDMGKLAFGGLAVLFPITFTILRLGGVNTGFAIASILIGEFLLVGFYYELIPDWLLFGFDSAIVVLTVCFIIIALGKLMDRMMSKS